MNTKQSHTTTHKTQATLQCWYREADDTFTSIHGDHIVPFHTWLNNLYPDIQWTYETEKEGRLNMLDLMVICAPNSSFFFETYRKPPHTGQYIAHNSHAPRSYLLATVRALTCRADKIPSTALARAAEHKKVRIDLAANGYTQNTYERGRYHKRNTTGTANNAQTNANPPTPPNASLAPSSINPLKTPTPPEDDKHLGHIAIPYCKGISEPMAHILKKSGISTHFASRGSFREQLIHLKDPVQRLQAACSLPHFMPGHTYIRLYSIICRRDRQDKRGPLEGPQGQRQVP
jgi:hypothetical protein